MDLEAFKSGGVPNLDCSDEHDLRAFAHFIRLLCFVKDFMEVVGIDDRAEAKAVMGALARYADQALESRSHREAGRIGKAMALESSNERIYQQLPQNVRW